jgi:hypothetical protein
MTPPYNPSNTALGAAARALRLATEPSDKNRICFFISFDLREKDTYLLTPNGMRRHAIPIQENIIKTKFGPNYTTKRHKNSVRGGAATQATCVPAEAPVPM